MSASGSTGSQQTGGPYWALGLLLSLAAAAAAVPDFPFDELVAGMAASGQGIYAICLSLGLTVAALDEHLARLGLTGSRRPHDRPWRPPGGRGWPLGDTVRLIVWRVRGVHPETIGERLGRSANAVRAKARRLGIPRPDRKLLHRPASLDDPVAGFDASAEAAAVEAARAEFGRGTVTNRRRRRGARRRRRADADAPDRISRLDERGPPAIAASVPERDLEKAHITQAREALSSRPQPEDTGVGRLSPSDRVEAGAAAAFTAVAATNMVVPGIDRQPSRLPIAEETWRVANARCVPPEVRPLVAALERRIRVKEVKLADVVARFADIRWVGETRRRQKSGAAMLVISLRYLGGQHYKGISEEAGTAVKDHLSRLRLPRDLDQYKFREHANLECALETWYRSDYVFVEKSGELQWMSARDLRNVHQSWGARREIGLDGEEGRRREIPRIALVTPREIAARRRGTPLPVSNRGTIEGCVRNFV